jgi:hexosaminidase
MKRLLMATCFSMALLQVGAQNTPVTSALIPMPVSMQAAEGNFTLSNNAAIELTSGNADAKRVAEMLAKKLAAPTGYAIPVKTAATNTAGNIQLAIVKDAALGNEGYKLTVNPNAVSITANSAAGLFYGTQTLLQLLPKEIEDSTVAANIAWTIPATTITDYPRFAWRGLMFDVSRHFFTKQEVKDFIDDMAKYKYNLLHLHLTDDQGWRIEIKSLPKLTEVNGLIPLLPIPANLKTMADFTRMRI